MKSPLEQFDIINVKSFYSFFFDYSLNNIILPFFFLIVIIYLIIIFYIYNFKLIALYIQNLLELIFVFISMIVRQQAGIYGFY
jgi:F0F1-type ATP synthase membrane subunit a